MGRRKKVYKSRGEYEARRHMVSFRFFPEQYEEIKIKCEKLGVDPTAWCRGVVLERVRGMDSLAQEKRKLTEKLKREKEEFIEERNGVLDAYGKELYDTGWADCSRQKDAELKVRVDAQVERSFGAYFAETVSLGVFDQLHKHPEMKKVWMENLRDGLEGMKHDPESEISILIDKVVKDELETVRWQTRAGYLQDERSVSGTVSGIDEANDPLFIFAKFNSTMKTLEHILGDPKDPRAEVFIEGIIEKITDFAKSKTKNPDDRISKALDDEVERRVRLRINPPHIERVVIPDIVVLSKVSPERANSEGRAEG